MKTGQPDTEGDKDKEGTTPPVSSYLPSSLLPPLPASLPLRWNWMEQNAAASHVAHSFPLARPCLFLLFGMRQRLTRGKKEDNVDVENRGWSVRMGSLLLHSRWPFRSLSLSLSDF